ncbi:MAG TPA: DHH family phosphoesterase [Alphaproteobacteria bacterium]|nr:DHH family phosphoesterase [Alphaproteobacteria bacterium]
METSEYNPDYVGFSKLLKESAEKFLLIPSNKTIRVIGHLDADGICASAIMISALIKLNRRYTLTILPAITEESLKPIYEESEDFMVFVDLGSGSIDTVGKVLTNKTLFILDHHHLQSETIYENVTQVNPHICGINGSDEISGAGVVFMFTQALTNNNNTEMSRIALVGAIGDIQEKDGFKKLNSDILAAAVENKYIEVKKGLKFFGVQTKPIYKLLQYSSDILIPGVNGSESGAINFLVNLGIDPKGKKGWKKISDLSPEESQKLVAGIIMNRTNKTGSDASDIFANTYILMTEQEDTPFRDAKEFATLLNSCGRLNKASIGIGACLNDKKMKDMALQNLMDYRKELVGALNWYKDNSSTHKVIKKGHYIIINAEDEVMPTMIGTLGSILSKSPEIKENTFLLSLARNHDDTTKISLRVVGNPDNVNLKELLEQVIAKINHGTSGGHSFAAGAVIDTDKEELFVKAAEEVLSSVVFEKLVI